MLFIVITMLVIVGVAGLVVTFVAFPHRGEHLPWLGDALNRAVGSFPTIADGELDAEPDAEPEGQQDFWYAGQVDRDAGADSRL